MNNMHVIVPIDSSVSCRFYLGLLNSKLLNWYYQTLNPEVGEALAEVKRTNVAALPVLAKTDTRLEKLVSRMQAAKQAGTTDSARYGHWSRESEVIDGQIDVLVYDLFGLEESEIAIIEN